MATRNNFYIRHYLKITNNSFVKQKVVNFRKMKRLFGSIIIITVVLVIGGILLFYSQGKRIDKNGFVSGRGILEVDTTPDNAKIYLDGKFKTNSDRNIENLKPGKYTVKIEKDRFSRWEKIIEIKEGLITPLKVTLFPSNPSLTAITFEGIYSPKISYDNKRVVFGIQSSTKAGLWVLDLSDPQIFFDNRLKQVASDSNLIQFSKSNFFWTANNKKILVEVQPIGSTQTDYYSLDPNKLNENPENISSVGISEKENITADILKNNQEKLKKLGSDAEVLADKASKIVFSKDNFALLIFNNDSSLVYDTKPNPLPNAKPITTILNKSSNYFFLQDSENHLVSVENNNLAILDRDGTNKVNLFTGDFDPQAVFSWPDGKRIVISINLNSKQNPLPNLYSINLE